MANLLTKNENESVININNSDIKLNSLSNHVNKINFTSSNSSFVQKRENAVNLQPLNLGQELLNENLEINSNSCSTSTAQQYDTANTNLNSCNTSAHHFNIKTFKPINIEFKNLTYTTLRIFPREKREIIRKLNGEFKSGELTAVMGPSGAGKSTLLDIISGYITKNITGDIMVNGHIRDSSRFRRQAAYIMQDHSLQPLLTVIEAMRFSAHLKLGNKLTQDDKNIIINKILDSMNLRGSINTRSGKLSGGQLKRLAIALELVNNPPVMIFDEPTSGLDSSTTNQIMSLLKDLALEGRTIICTIHQPSALVFDMFDHLFAMASGQCIYTGTTVNLVPFLGELNIICPIFYSPSDFLLEISTNDYGDKNPELIEKTENGGNTQYRKSSQNQLERQLQAKQKIEKMMQAGVISPVQAPDITINELIPDVQSPLVQNRDPWIRQLKNRLKECYKRDDRYSASILQQFCIISRRTFLILRRDHSLTSIRILIHLIVSLFIGVMYFGIGNEANHMLNNFRYVFFSIMFLMFTAFSSMTISFPLELPIIAREYFNRWYSLKAYYTAMTLADVPIQLACTLIYILITYFMTNQPLDPVRFGLFFFICLLVTLVSQSFGVLTGSIFDVKHAAIWGPFFILPFLIFSGFFVTMKDAPPFSHWLFHISFLKYALEGAVLAIFGYERKKMECNALFCPYSIPKKFLNDISMENGSYTDCVIALFVIFFILRISTYFIVLYKLRHRR